MLPTGTAEEPDLPGEFGVFMAATLVVLTIFDFPLLFNGAWFEQNRSWLGCVRFMSGVIVLMPMLFGSVGSRSEARKKAWLKCFNSEECLPAAANTRHRRCSVHHDQQEA